MSFSCLQELQSIEKTELQGELLLLSIECTNFSHDGVPIDLLSQFHPRALIPQDKVRYAATKASPSGSAARDLLPERLCVGPYLLQPSARRGFRHRLSDGGPTGRAQEALRSLRSKTV